KDNGIKYKSLHMEHDPNFGGGMPEPKPKYMTELIETIKNSKNSVGFANDGDGDRFGVIDENGNYVTPNEIIAILLKHLTKNKGLKGSLVKTVGASTLLDIVAKKSNVELIETAVGFKHVGEAMRKYNPVIAGEDSGGLSIQGHIPEKDGILANLLILEAMAYENKTLVELEEDLHNFAGAKFYNDRIDEKLENQEQVKKALENAEKMKQLGKYKVKNINQIDGVKLYFEDNSWILVRPSGTEPLLRIYIECDSIEKLEEFKENIKNASIA
ncbi:phosphoglucomutase/phosphomannomutase family protein, partial [bacterium]|nr:phosphoglucomutase/phosphomannomutase family protein [bacterium]